MGNKERLLTLSGVALSFFIRWKLFPFESLDYVYFFGPWLHQLQLHGLWKCLGSSFTTYTPLYDLSLQLSSYLLFLFSPLVAFKLVLVVFDYLNATLAYKILLFHGFSYQKAMIGFFVVIFSPTVVMNSSLWGQVDAMHTCGMVASVYFLMKQKHWAAMIAFGLALSIKPQTIFLFPLFLLFVFQQRISWALFLIPPIIYLLTMIPSLLAGRPFLDMLFIFRDQVKRYTELSANAANWYQWFGIDHHEGLFYLGNMVNAIFVMGTIIVLVRKNRVFCGLSLLILATYFCLGVPFFLPRMHERYFFPADILSLILAVWKPSMIFPALLIQTGSALSYFPFLFGGEPVSLKVLATFNFAALLMLARAVFRINFDFSFKALSGPR